MNQKVKHSVDITTTLLKGFIMLSSSLIKPSVNSMYLILQILVLELKLLANKTVDKYSSSLSFHCCTTNTTTTE